MQQGQLICTILLMLVNGLHQAGLQKGTYANMTQVELRCAVLYFILLKCHAENTNVFAGAMRSALSKNAACLPHCCRNAVRGDPAEKVACHQREGTKPGLLRPTGCTVHQYALSHLASSDSSTASPYDAVALASVRAHARSASSRGIDSANSTEPSTGTSCGLPDVLDRGTLSLPGNIDR